jgi:hypothetical protein
VWLFIQAVQPDQPKECGVIGAFKRITQTVMSGGLCSKGKERGQEK